MSVCSSVYHTRALWRNERPHWQYFDATWKGNHSSLYIFQLAVWRVRCVDRLSDDVLALTFNDTVHKVTWSTLDVHARQLARSVSQLLHTITRIVNVHPDAAALTTSRSDAGLSSALLLKIDNTRCVSRCFTSARSAAAFIAVYRARQLGTLNITSVAGTSSVLTTHSLVCTFAGQSIESRVNIQYYSNSCI